MKKSLLAVAAIGAFASAAQAQSSVTVYGILDAGYVGGSTRISNNAAQTKTNVSQFGQGGETTNRLGFKGTEDLGGGASAFFTAEFQLYPQDQTLSGNTTSTTNNVGGLLNRQTFVGLSKKGIGQFALGTQYTAVFSAQAATDPGQTNNIIGSITYPSSTAIAAPGDANNQAVTTAFTNRTSNTLSLASDTYAGFKASGFLTANSKTATATAPAGTITAGGQTDSTGWGLRGEYTLQKFYITAAYQALSQNTSATNVAAATPWTNAQANGATAAPLTTGTAVDVRDNQAYVGATYDFGILKAYAQYVNRKATNTVNTNYYLSRSGQQLGVRSFITPTIEGWASIGNGRYRTFGENAPTANMNAWQLGSNYWLSKRTNLYAIYGQQNISQAASATYNGSSNANNYAVGLRHTF